MLVAIVISYRPISCVLSWDSLFFSGYALVAVPSTKGKGRGWDKALSVILALTILGAIGTLGYAIASPKVGEKFTEFYIEGLEGKAADYPLP